MDDELDYEQYGEIYHAQERANDRFIARIRAALEDFELGRMTITELRAYVRRISY